MRKDTIARSKHATWFIVLYASLIISYMIVAINVESFFELQSKLDRIQNGIHSFLHSLFLPSILTLVLRFRKGFILCIVLLFIYLLTIIGNLIYFGYFDALISIQQFSHAQYLNEIGTQIWSQFVTWKEFVVLICAVISFIACYKLSFLCRRLIIFRHSRESAIFWVFPSAILLLLAGKLAIMLVRHSPEAIWESNRVQFAKQFGFVGYYSMDSAKLLKPRQPMPPFPGKINPAPKKSFEKFDPYVRPNIIILQVESLDAKALAVTIDDKPLLSNLNELKSRALYFTHFFAQHRGGSSQDAELATLFSILPLNDRSGFPSIRMGETRSLAEVLKDQGYSTAAFHANVGQFFARSDLLPKAGFEKFYDARSFSGRASGWDSRDPEFLMQSVDLLKGIPQPFFGYLITMQSHGPWLNHSVKSKNLGLDSSPPQAQNYLRCQYEVDLAIGQFLERLGEDEHFENSIIIIFGDHSSRVRYDAHTYPFEDKPPEHVPLFILTPDRRAETRKTTSSHLDVAPTIAHMIGIEEPGHWLGSSLLDITEGKVILNYPTPITIRNKGEGIIIEAAGTEAQSFVNWSKILQAP